MFREHRRNLRRRLARIHGRAVLQSLVLMPATSALLSRMGFARTRDIYDRLARVGGPMDKRVDPHRLVHSIDVVAMRLMPERTCLARALVVDLLLRRAGYAPAMHVGARRDGNGLRAHAWVELDNVVLGRVDDRYHSMGTINPASTASSRQGGAT